MNEDELFNALKRIAAERKVLVDLDTGEESKSVKFIKDFINTYYALFQFIISFSSLHLKNV